MKKSNYSENKIKLENLLVLRSVEKTDKYDKEILTVKKASDFFEYGII